MKSRIGYRLFLSSVATVGILLFATTLPALDVNGTLSSGVWRATDSPIRVTGDIFLPDGQQLTIEPGVRVEFQGPYVFVISGLLIADGTSTSRILFTAAQPGVDSLRWRGLRFIQATRGSRLSFCRVEYGWARGEWPLNCGGGIYLESCSPTITRSEIEFNRADQDGGGMYGWFTSSLLKNNLIVSNRAGNFGGGVFIAYSNPQFLNCTVAFDTARGWGGGIFVGAQGKPQIINSILTNNTQILFLDDALDDNNLPAGDVYMPNLGRVQSAQPEVSFSNVTIGLLNPYPGSGNISADPQFVNVTTRPFDFRLKYSSACIDAGDPRMNALGEPDVLVNRINMGSDGNTENATRSVPVVYSDRAANNIAVNFDSVRINTQVSAEVRIENRGHYRLYIRDFAFTNSDFFPDSTEVEDQFIPTYKVAPIEPGDIAKFTIQFRPRSLRSYSDTLRFITSDTLFGVDPLHPAPLDSSRRWPFIVLRGAGIDPIAVCDTTMTFGRRQIGTQTPQTLTIRNTGRSDLVVSSVATQGEGFSASIVNRTIAPNGQGAITVTFSPSAPEVYEKNLTIRTNDRNMFVLLSGRGYGPKLVLLDTSKFVGYVYFGGDTLATNIPVKNDGDEELHITRVDVATVRGLGGAFSPALPDGGLRIAPDSTGYVKLLFHPPQASVADSLYEARFTFNSNYPVPRYYRLTGRGMDLPGRYVFGEVSGVWDWAPGTPDYIVLDSVIVPAYERLRIMPGARVLFEPGAFIRAEGEIRAIGLPTDSIRFLPRDASGTPASRWKGFEILNEDVSRLAYCVIRGSKKGLKVVRASPRIQYSTFANNQDTTNLGGGLYFENSGSDVIGCVFEDNRARHGGGIYALNSKPQISNCIIRNNNAVNGGAVYLRFLSGALMQSNLIYGNRASGFGGGIAIYENSAPRIVNNTIVDNFGGGVYAAIRSLPTLLNTILYNNGGASLTTVNGANALVSYCDIEGGFTGQTNLDVVPEFDPAGDLPYLLLDASALIDRGNPERSHRDYSFPPSKGSSRNDIGAYGGALGGGWQAPDIAIGLFQNPAFPLWLDIIVTSLQPFTTAPVCSLEFSGGAMEIIGLTAIDQYNYRGKWESSGSGSLFLTSEGTVSGGEHQKIGRDFELLIASSRETSLGLIPGVGGTLTVLPGTLDRTTTIICGYEPQPPKPEEGLIFISPVVTLNGLGSNLNKPAELAIPIGNSDLSTSELKRLAIFQSTEYGWTRLDGGYDNGMIKGLAYSDGKFAVALSAGEFAGKPVTPTDYVILQSFPNPFNNRVMLEFSIPTGGRAELSVWDIAGRRVTTLVSGDMKAGRHTVEWNGIGTGGEAVASGIYWARLATPDGSRSVKLLLLR